MFVRHTKRCLIITVMFGTVFFWLYASGRADSAKNYLELPYVVVHIDLKGMPPKLSYLKSILPKLKELGANALLMEYEDMFPYEGSIRNISSKHAYSKLHLSEFLRAAQTLGFEIIPLVQTFGHLEFVLKHWEFAHLRENAFSPDSICPTNDDSHTLIETMLQQVFQFHNNISPLKHFHIGCDEVYNINLCPRCKERKLQNLKLFVEHVNNVRDILKTINPNITVLIWDDMMRKVNKSNVLITNNLDDVEPVFWSYDTSVWAANRPFQYYMRKFGSTWLATAYKGADGRTRMLPNLTERFYNNFYWLKYMFKHRYFYKFKGIILTGWSRYSHLDPPCELLPVSMPSLTLNLLVAKKFKNGIEINGSHLPPLTFYQRYLEEDWSKHFYCRHDFTLQSFYAKVWLCKLPDRELMSAIYRMDRFHKIGFETYFSDDKGLNTVDFYYKRYNIVSPNAYSYRHWVRHSLSTLENYTNHLPHLLMEYYDPYLVDEYVHFKTVYLKTILSKLYSNLINFETARYWNRSSERYEVHVPKT